MPDRYDIEEQKRADKEIRDLAHQLAWLERRLDHCDPSKERWVQGVTFRLRDDGWLIVVRAVDGVDKVVTFRNAEGVVAWIPALIQAITNGSWRADRPFTDKASSGGGLTSV